MHKTFSSILRGLTLAAVAACSNSSSPATSGETGGAMSATGSSGGTAGQTPSTTGSGGGGTFGSGGTGGATGGATGGGGSGGGTGGAGGGGGGGGGGTGGSGGTSNPVDASTADTSVGGDANSPIDAAVIGDARAPVPSAGCGKMNPLMGSRTVITGGQTGTFNVSLPTGYTATTPMPLGFGFHGANNPACGPTGGECQGFAALKAVTVYMKSFGTNWEGATLQQNLTFFDDVLALMKNEYCIDESHIFVAGVSSGGQFIEYLTCRYGDWLWQTTAVSAAVVNAANMNCKGTPPVLVIHGVTDSAGNYGQGVAEMFAQRNGCSATAPAGLAQAKTDMMTAFTAMQAQHVCLDWDGCMANPVRFCISSQITYSGLTHGWPRVGGTLISDFQAGLR
jgi:poly(3-hydroxybutyrate) depolymerase